MDQFKFLQFVMWGALFVVYFGSLYISPSGDDDLETCGLEDNTPAEKCMIQEKEEDAKAMETCGADDDATDDKCVLEREEDFEAMVTCKSSDEPADGPVKDQKKRDIIKDKIKTAPERKPMQQGGPQLEYFVDSSADVPETGPRRRFRVHTSPRSAKRTSTTDSGPGFLSFINWLSVRVAICAYCLYLANLQSLLIYIIKFLIFITKKLVQKIKVQMNNWKEEQEAMKGERPKAKPKSKIPIPAKEKEEPPPRRNSLSGQISSDDALTDPLPFSDPVLRDSPTTQVMKVVESKQWSVSGHVVKSAQRIKYIPIKRSKSH